MYDSLFSLLVRTTNRLVLEESGLLLSLENFFLLFFKKNKQTKILDLIDSIRSESDVH